MRHGSRSHQVSGSLAWNPNARQRRTAVGLPQSIHEMRREDGAAEGPQVWRAPAAYGLIAGHPGYTAHLHRMLRAM